MKSSSDSQYQANLAGTVPDLELVREGTWAMGLTMPSPHIRHSFSYAIRDDRDSVHLVDTSWNSDENWEQLQLNLARIGSSVDRVASIAVTHLHRDHLGMAGRIRAASGATIAMHEDELHALNGRRSGITITHEVQGRLVAWGVPEARRGELEAIQGMADSSDELPIDTILRDQDRLDIPGRDIRVIHTPGHTAGSACFVDHENGILFSGDHVLPTMYPGLGLGGVSKSNALADYLASLARVAELEDFEVLPGHGYRFTGLEDRCSEIAEHHLRRSSEVSAGMASGEATVWEIASQLTWTAGWEKLEGFYLLSALSQTSMHMDYLVRAGQA